MYIKVNKYKLSDVLLTLCVGISLLGLSYNGINYNLNKFISSSKFAVGLGYFSLILTITFCFLIFRVKRLKLSSMDFALCIFSIYIFVMYIFSMDVFNPHALFNCFSLLLWIVAFEVGRLFGKYHEKGYDNVITMCFVIAFLPICFYIVLFYISNNFITYFQGNDALFGIIVYMPLLMILKNKDIRTVSLLLLAILSVLSLKRSIILAYCVSIVVYALIVVRRNSFTRFYGLKHKIILLLVLTGFIVVFSRLYNILGVYVLDRFSGVLEDGGSGRDSIISDILASFISSPIDKQIFGHGYKGTLVSSGFLAHNDILQILYDFGYLGCALYLFVLFHLVRKIRKNYKFRKVNEHYYAAYVVSVLLLLILSLLNCFIYSPSFIAPIYLFLGLLIERNENIIYHRFVL